MGTLLGLLFDAAVDLAVDKLREVQRKRAAAEAWARRPAPVRACKRCGEAAYTPGLASCTKCGAVL